MKVCSFDIGIRNLAGCIAEVQPNNDTAVVSWWQVINLLDDTRRCDGIVVGTGERCDHPAILGLSHKDFYCGVHKNQYSAEKLCTVTTLTTPAKCSQRVGKKPCGKNAAGLVSCKGSFVKGRLILSETETNTPMCAKHRDALLKVAEKATQLKAVKPPKVKDTDMDTIKLTLWKKLDSLPELLQVDEVLIENQPSLKNPSMKAIADTLYAYFLCRGLVDKSVTNSTIQAIRYMSPSNKARLVPEFQAKLKEIKGAAAKKYKLTKDFSIKHSQTLLQDDPTTLDWLNSNKKKDDLCDALLQLCYYVSTLSDDAGRRFDIKKVKCRPDSDSVASDVHIL